MDTTTSPKLLGEVISWSARGAAVTFDKLKESLAEADLDPALARELLPKSAFARACRKLTDRHIIKPVPRPEEPELIVFQFTREFLEAGEYHYDRETEVRLHRTTGEIQCDIPELEAEARRLFGEAMIRRTSNDITSTVKRAFKKAQGVLSILKFHESGFCYVIPEQHVAFVDQVHKFMKMIGGKMDRLPIAGGTAEGARTMKDVLSRGVEDLLADYEKHITEFTADTTGRSFKTTAERITAAKFKLECYSELLGEKRAQLEASLAELSDKLRTKVEEAAAAAEETDDENAEEERDTPPAEYSPEELAAVG